MVLKKIIHIRNLFNACISEILRGHADEMLRELLYVINMRMINNIDIGYVNVCDLGFTGDIAHSHCGSGGPNLEKVINALNITQENAIIDIGCGKGGSLITLAKYPFKKLAGIDLSPDLINVAQENLRKMGIRNVALYCCDASNFSNFDEFDYIYMYNPFPCQVMEKVMIHISESIVRSPRDLIIIYNSPECHEVILKTSLFEHIASFDNFKSQKLFIYKHETL